MVELIKLLNLLRTTNKPNYLSVSITLYKKYKFLFKVMVFLNKNYINCEIFRRKFKEQRNFVVIGLRYSEKKAKRRTSGFAKDFVRKNKNSKCLYCNTKLDLENATADHIVPISKGGSNVQVNLVVCCKSCNSERKDNDFVEFLKYKNKEFLKMPYPFF